MRFLKYLICKFGIHSWHIIRRPIRSFTLGSKIWNYEKNSWTVYGSEYGDDRICKFCEKIKFNYDDAQQAAIEAMGEEVTKAQIALNKIKSLEDKAKWLNSLQKKAT